MAFTAAVGPRLTDTEEHRVSSRENMSMNPFELPEQHFFARKEVLLWGIEERLAATAKYAHETYEDREALLNAWDFCSHDLVEAPSSRIDHLAKVGTFPWAEASNELDQSLSLIMNGHYKNAFDSLRRALELVVTGSYFVLDDVERAEVIEWMKSQRGTPNFSHALSRLLKDEAFKRCDSECRWKAYMQELYYRLCDVVHVKGVSNSLQNTAPSFSNINGIGSLAFDNDSCKNALDAFVETVRAIACTVALSNPVLLVGFDLDIKFGLNPPFSGFFYPGQADLLRSLIDERFQPFIEHLTHTDEKVQSVVSWFNTLPDITTEQFAQQARTMGFPLTSYSSPSRPDVNDQQLP